VPTGCRGASATAAPTWWRRPAAWNGTFSPDGTRFVYTPLQSEFRGWKRHHGGRAQDIWIYDLKADTAQRITDYPGTNNLPMWVGDRIYFTSDRDHTLNLYAYDLRSKEVRKLTRYDNYDVLWPSADPAAGRIVYENGGELYLYETATGMSTRVPIRIYSDLPQTLPYFKNVRGEIEASDISPTGKRALFTARGRVLTVPAEKGQVVTLAADPGVRALGAVWSPDGRQVAYLSDRSGEYEIYVRNPAPAPADNAGGAGTAAERRVTTDGDTWRFPLVWSPDSRKIAFADKKLRLRYVDVASGRVVDADRGTYGRPAQYSWSPDSRYIVYVKPARSRFLAIWLYELQTGRVSELSNELANDAEPVFDPAGRYLYFISNRDFNLAFSDFEFDYVYDCSARVYAALLAKDGPALFRPESDDEPAGGGAGGAAAHPAAPPQVRIDVDGFADRVRALPGAAGVYRNLQANADAVFYLAGPDGGAKLKTVSLKEMKESDVLDGVAGFQLSADGKKLLFQHGESWGIVDARPGQKATDGLLALDRLEVQVEPRAEWRQMYHDAWRIMRDWFYDPAMHGLDWRAIGDRYGALLPYLGSRDDLDFLLEELGAELSAGHVYVTRGDDPGVPRVESGLLGADIEADPSGFFRITRILAGESWNNDLRSPLTEPGVHAREGELILAVDGQPTRGVDNFYRLLENKGDRVVTLRLAAAADGAAAHDERVRPVKNEQDLRYFTWVKANRERVDRMSGGRIGYIHMPDTAVAGNRELFKYFYPQAGRQALILDDRYNGGGFMPDRMMALLSRPLLSYWVHRDAEDPDTVPAFVNTGPKVCLINGSAGSGGDAFPYYFRKLGMGPLIGTRTWGGLIGLNGNPSLIDGGQLSTPSLRFLDTEGHWGIENVGVPPDIELIDRPDEIAKGHDPSLERAVAYLLDQLDKHPPVLVKVPPIPPSPY
jgi:tricorn protease